MKNMKKLKFILSIFISTFIISTNVFAEDNNIINENEENIIINNNLFNNDEYENKLLNSYSNENYNYNVLEEYTIEEIAEKLNVSVSDINEIKNEEYFNEIILSSLELAETSQDENSAARNSSVGISTIRKYVRPGDIHITPINKTNGIRHGHAALAFDAYNNIEIQGEGYKSAKLTNNGWGNYSAYRLYRTNLTTLDAAAVAINASKNLLGLEYYGLSNVYNNEVNCATLVWKAFNNGGLTLEHNGILPYAPKTITLSSKVDWVISFGWTYI